MVAVNEHDPSSYDLEPAAEVPDLPGSVRMGDDDESALDMLAADLFVHSMSCVSSFGHFHLALSHGWVQERLVMKLMTDPKYRSIPWDRTHIWSVSERIIEPGHPEHSMTHWRELAAEAGGVPDEQFHPIQAHDHDAPGSYERELIEHLEKRQRGHDRLDFAILGDEADLLHGIDDPMGRLVGMSEDAERVMLTRRLLNATRTIAIMGIGLGGRSLVDTLRGNHDQVGLRPDAGTLRWYLDAYACRCSDEEPL